MVRRGAPPLLFTADRWLAADEEDGLTWATLVPGGAALLPRVPSWQQQQQERQPSLTGDLKGGVPDEAQQQQQPQQRPSTPRSPFEALASTPLRNSDGAQAATVRRSGVSGQWLEVGISSEGPVQVVRQVRC